MPTATYTPNLTRSTKDAKILVLRQIMGHRCRVRPYLHTGEGDYEFIIHGYRITDNNRVKIRIYWRSWGRSYNFKSSVVDISDYNYKVVDDA